MKQGPAPKTSQAHLDAPNWLHARTYQSSGDVEVGQPESHQHKVDPPQQVPAGVPAGSGVEATGEHVSKVFHFLQEWKGDCSELALRHSQPTSHSYISCAHARAT